MESWHELLRKKSLASLDALVARFRPEQFPDLERLRQAALDVDVVPDTRYARIPGGRPLLLRDGRIDELCRGLRAIPHLEIIRIGSRVPCHLPARITPELCDVLRRDHPLCINAHLNRPDELTP